MIPPIPASLIIIAALKKWKQDHIIYDSVMDEELIGLGVARATYLVIGKGYHLWKDREEVKGVFLS